MSVIVPCYNERATISECVRSVLANGYGAGLEVLVVDGGSTDGSREIVRELETSDPRIRLIDNPQRTVQHAMNRGIESAKHEAILVVGGHSILFPGYLRRCAEVLVEHDADAVGGRVETIPREQTIVGRAIAGVMSSRFGVGRSHFRVTQSTDEPRHVPSVVFGLYRRDVFRKVGHFNVNMARSEDLEFHRRMRDAGCKMMFAPDALASYVARSRYFEFLRHSLDNGKWTILPAAFTGRREASLWHLVPMGFVAGLSVLGVAAIWMELARLLLIVIAGFYLLAAMLASLASMRRVGGGAALLLPLMFVTLHLAYGIGSVVGASIVLRRRITGRGRPC